VRELPKGKFILRLTSERPCHWRRWSKKLSKVLPQLPWPKSSVGPPEPDALVRQLKGMPLTCRRQSCPITFGAEAGDFPRSVPLPEARRESTREKKKRFAEYARS